MRATHQMHHVVLILLQEIATREEQQEEDVEEHEVQHQTKGGRGRISMHGKHPNSDTQLNLCG